MRPNHSDKAFARVIEDGEYDALWCGDKYIMRTEHKNSNLNLFASDINKAHQQAVKAAENTARLIELDLLEQALNAGRDLHAYKLQRLEALLAKRKAS